MEFRHAGNSNKKEEGLKEDLRILILCLEVTMRNCLIMGFGRSGTSLMGGILHEAGYYMGEELYPPRHSNPKGFFENAMINGINERILKRYDYSLQGYGIRDMGYGMPDPGKKWSPFIPGEGHRWLSYIPPDTNIKNDDPEILKDIREVLSPKGFAYKDPRFNYTLDIWEPLLDKGTLFLCIFREPGITIESVIKECETAEYLSEFSIDGELAETLWCNSYLHLLKKSEQMGPERFIFIHYEQLLSGDILQHISNRLKVTLKSDFVSNELSRVKTSRQVSGSTQQIYRKFCDLAGYNDY